MSKRAEIILSDRDLQALNTAGHMLFKYVVVEKNGVPWDIMLSLKNQPKKENEAEHT